MNHEAHEAIARLGSFAACEVTASQIRDLDLVVLAAKGLAACCSAASEPPPEVLDVIRIGEREWSWSRGHQAFDAVRELTLEADRRGVAEDSPSLRLLLVAENAAAVIYNATKPRDPFDADRGARLLWSMWRFAESLPSKHRELLQHQLAQLIKLPPLHGG